MYVFLESEVYVTAFKKWEIHVLEAEVWTHGVLIAYGMTLFLGPFSRSFQPNF